MTRFFYELDGKRYQVEADKYTRNSVQARQITICGANPFQYCNGPFAVPDWDGYQWVYDNSNAGSTPGSFYDYFRLRLFFQGTQVWDSSQATGTEFANPSFSQEIVTSCATFFLKDGQTIRTIQSCPEIQKVDDCSECCRELLPIMRGITV